MFDGGRRMNDEKSEPSGSSPLDAYMRNFVLLITTLFAGCGLCGNDPIHAEKSPDGRYVAIAFIRDCGVTTGFSTQVSILKAPGRLPNEVENVFIADWKLPLSLRWDGNQKLLIEGSLGSRASRKLQSFQGIAIEYR
jgi:hypothetical protein